MSSPETEQATAKCAVKMHDGKDCGREVYDQRGKCICHSADSDKDAAAIQREINGMLERKDCDFTRFVFPEGISFEHARFEGDAYFGGARFGRFASFSAATLRGMADFGAATFEGEAFFDRATFQRAASFLWARFEGEADFRAVTFQGEADFNGAAFRGEADLSAATFQGIANFGGARFRDEADFGRATFRGDARFILATFEGVAAFLRATFQGKVDFDVATLQGTALFLDARFEGEVRFIGQGEGRVFTSGANADFRHARFGQPENVVFQHVFLGRARFLNADVRRVDFTDVQWATRPGGHCAVWDELAPGEKDYALIGKLYRQLKHNYEEQRDPITAGDFHIGEMQMRRLLNPPRNWLWRFLKRNLSFLALYRWISGYGEDYVRPLAWIVGMVLLFAVAFTFIPALALQSSAASGAPQLVDGWWPRLLHSVMCFLWRGGRPFQPVHLVGHYVSVVEGIIGPPLLAMFVLALNRRFKR